MKKIEYTPQALNSLKAITIYYKNEVNNQIATKITSQIRDSIDELSVFPYRCPVSGFSKNIRWMRVQNVPYNVYYSIEEFCILILEILHQRQDHSFLIERYRDK